MGFANAMMGKQRARVLGGKDDAARVAGAACGTAHTLTHQNSQLEVELHNFGKKAYDITRVVKFWGLRLGFDVDSWCSPLSNEPSYSSHCLSGRTVRAKVTSEVSNCRGRGKGPAWELPAGG